MWSKRYFIAFFVALFTSLFLAPLTRKIAYLLNFLDYPDERKNHPAPIPVLGGLAIYIAIVAGVFFTFYYSHALKVILLGGLITLLLGIVDDKRDVPATVKVIVLFVLVLVLSRFGVLIKFCPYYIPNLLITLFWVVFITGAVNAVDNMDGLACGISAIASALFFIAALRTYQYLFGIISAALLGATLGFLPYNFKPAKIFLGNGGSLFLGFTLASIAIIVEWSDYPLISYLIPVFILIIPIFDLSFVVLWRIRKGITKTIKEAITYSARDHLSHRLENLGFTQRRAVVLLYLLNLGIGMSAVIILPIDSLFEAALLLFQSFIILLILATVINIGWRDLKR